MVRLPGQSTLMNRWVSSALLFTSQLLAKPWSKDSIPKPSSLATASGCFTRKVQISFLLRTWSSVRFYLIIRGLFKSNRGSAQWGCPWVSAPKSETDHRCWVLPSVFSLYVNSSCLEKQAQNTCFLNGKVSLIGSHCSLMHKNCMKSLEERRCGYPVC